MKSEREKSRNRMKDQSRNRMKRVKERMSD